MKIKGFKLGATRQFPYGKADEDDEGELRLAMATDYHNSIVRVEFGKPIGWLGLPAQQAREFAAILIEKANELDARKT